MTQVRNDFNTLINEQKVTDFISKYEESSLHQSKPYVSAAIMKQAEYTIFPHKKLSYFNKGKGKLEQFIKNNPSNIEGRYTRVLVQKKAPSFLGYKSNIAADRAFIIKNISTSKLPKDYQKFILKNIK